MWILLIDSTVSNKYNIVAHCSSDYQLCSNRFCVVYTKWELKCNLFEVKISNIFKWENDQEGTDVQYQLSCDASSVLEIRVTPTVESYPLLKLKGINLNKSIFRCPCWIHSYGVYSCHFWSFHTGMPRFQHDMGMGTRRKRIQGTDSGVQDGDT